MIDISVSDKHMKPQVIHTDQFENGVHVIRFTIADYMQNDVDLRKFEPYVVTSINGEMDVTYLTPPTQSGRSLSFTWSLSSHTLKNPGVIQYQLVLSKSAEDGNVVWNSYKGVIVNRLAINADDHMSANYPTLMKQWLDLMHTLSGAFGAPITYMLPGDSIPVEERLENRVYYQWLDTYNSRATCATGTVKLGKRPYADSGLYINNTHICVDTTEDEVYVLDPKIWVDAINNADCGVIATDISVGDDILLLISAKNSGASGNDIGLKLDVAVYGKGKGIVNPSGGDKSGETLAGGSDSTVGVSYPRGRFEDAHGNILHYGYTLEDFNYTKGSVQEQIDSLRSLIVEKSMVPDCSATISVTSPYTASSNGYVVSSGGNSTQLSHKVNGNSINSDVSGGSGGVWIITPVAKNDVIEFGGGSHKFIPCK